MRLPGSSALICHWKVNNEYTAGGLLGVRDLLKGEFVQHYGVQGVGV